MACTPITLNGIPLSCGVNSGGINTLYIVDKQNVTAVAFGGSNAVSGLTMSGSTKFATYNLRKNLSTFEETYNNDDTGSRYVSTTITAVFDKQSETMRDEIEKILSTQVYVIVKDNNGKYRLVGYSKNTDTYVYANGVGTTGTARLDVNQFTLTLMSEQDELSFYVDPSAMTAII